MVNETGLPVAIKRPHIIPQHCALYDGIKRNSRTDFCAHFPTRSVSFIMTKLVNESVSWKWIVKKSAEKGKLTKESLKPLNCPSECIFS